MTHYDRVAAFVAEHRPHAACAGCIAKVLGLRPGAAQRATVKLEGAPEFVRQYAECSLCGTTRLAVRAAARHE